MGDDGAPVIARRGDAALDVVERDGFAGEFAEAAVDFSGSEELGIEVDLANGKTESGR